jgi:hypothetical protein
MSDYERVWVGQRANLFVFDRHRVGRWIVDLMMRACCCCMREGWGKTDYWNRLGAVNALSEALEYAYHQQIGQRLHAGRWRFLRRLSVSRGVVFNVKKHFVEGQELTSQPRFEKKILWGHMRPFLRFSPFLLKISIKISFFLAIEKEVVVEYLIL